MALAPCVRIVLCGLSAATLSALDAIVAQAEAQLQTQRALLVAQAARVDVALIPVEATRDIAQTALGALSQYAGLLPTSLIAGCADLGDFSLNLSAQFDILAADLNDTLDDVSRLVSFREELNAALDEADAALQQIGEVRAVLAECAGAGAGVAA